MTSEHDAAFALFVMSLLEPTSASTLVWAFVMASEFFVSCAPLSFSLFSSLLQALRVFDVSSSYFRQTLKAFLQALSCFAIASDSVLNEQVLTVLEVVLSVVSDQQVHASAPFFFVQDLTESAKVLVLVAQASNLVLLGCGKFEGLQAVSIAVSHSSNFVVKFAN